MIDRAYDIESLCLREEIMFNSNATPYFDMLWRQDVDTGKHSRRVCLWAIQCGRDNNVSEWEERLLGLAGLLHDIGKRLSDLDILRKRGKYTEEERGAIKKHMDDSLDILGSYSPSQVRDIVAYSHEFYEDDPYRRKGMERRKKGRVDKERRNNDQRIGELGIMLAIGDGYDRIISPYKSKKVSLYEGAIVFPASVEELRENLSYKFSGNKKFIENFVKHFTEING